MIFSALILAALLLQAAAGQTSAHVNAPPAGTEEPRGEISGRCVSAQTGEGLRGVSVQILSASDHGRSHQQSVLTADDGSFTFQHVPGGSYSVAAYKSGYRAFPGLSRPFTLETKGIKRDFEIKLNRPAVITGRVTDGDGQPVTNARVSADRLLWQMGRRMVFPADSATTDDRGVYRLFHLPAGRYVVAATPPPGDQPRGERNVNFVRAFYPSGSSAAQASRLEARWGQELSEINLVLERRETFSVSGVVADSEAAGPCHTCLVHVTRLGEVETSVQFEVAADGSYRATGLVPGAYRITAVKPSGGHHILASRTVQIGSDNLRDVNLLVGVSHTVSGRVLFDPPEDAPDKSDMRVALAPSEDMGPFVFRVLSNLTFVAEGLSAGPNLVSIQGLPAGSYLKSARLGGQELLSPEIEVPEDGDLSQLELVVGIGSAAVSGQVKLPDSPSEGHRVTAAIVALFPQTNESPFLSETFASTDSSGSFKATGVAPGSFTVFAFPAGGTQEWRDPELRRPIENYGKPVELKAGQSQTIELPLAPQVGEP